MIPADRPDPALEQATEWLLQVQAAPADAALRRQVEAWVAADPSHARAWDQARRTWRALGAVEASAAPRHRPRRAVWFSAATALAACLLLVLLPDLSLRWRADHHSGTGEIRIVTLEDGSQVQMAPHSALRVQFQDGKRQVELLHGQAFFQVVRDPARPFTVAAGAVTATVLGTAFDVHLTDTAVAVAVESGKVAIADAANGQPLAAPLTAGTRAVMRPGAAAAVENVPPEVIADWRSGQLFFADATIAEVVSALSVYHSGWIVVADSALAATRVTGLYDPYDKDRALRALVRPANGRVTIMGPLTVLTAH